MNDVLRLSFLIFSCFLLSIDNSEALKCYQCSGPKEKGLECEKHVEMVHQQTCPVVESACISYVFQAIAGPPILHRGCARDGYCHTLVQNSTEFNLLKSCQDCKEDLCNSSVKRGFYMFGIFLLITASVLII